MNKMNLEGLRKPENRGVVTPKKETQTKKIVTFQITRAEDEKLLKKAKKIGLTKAGLIRMTLKEKDYI